MKTFVLSVSGVFPITHKRKGQETLFIGKIKAVVYPDNPNNFGWMNAKIHTIRANYELWKKRIEQVQKGEAILSIRYWSGKPYNSKQVEICQLDKDSGIGVQKLDFDHAQFIYPRVWDINYQLPVIVEEIAKNDGLSLEDFKEWFKKYDLSESMAIIHFTKFRY